jgi:hypothetical protein
VWSAGRLYPRRILIACLHVCAGRSRHFVMMALFAHLAPSHPGFAKSTSAAIALTYK